MFFISVDLNGFQSQYLHETTGKLCLFSRSEENLEAAANCRSSRSKPKNKNISEHNLELRTRAKNSLNPMISMISLTCRKHWCILASPFNRSWFVIRQWPAWRCCDASGVRSSTLRGGIGIPPFW